MNGTTYSARVTRPIAWRGKAGEAALIPAGHCLIERSAQDRTRADVIWGRDGEHCVNLPVPLLKVAQRDGRLQLIC